MKKPSHLNNNLPEDLDLSHLFELSYDIFKATLLLKFFIGPDTPNIIVELTNVIHFQASRGIDDDVFTNFLAEVRLVEVTDGGKELFEEIKYPFLNFENQRITYPDRTLYHLNVEGELCLQAISAGYTLYEQTSSSMRTST
jgi:hypothetical protein